MAPVDTETENEIFDKISNNDIAGVKTILSQSEIKADVYDKHGMTPLQHAAYKGNKELVQLLLDQGADVNSGKHEYNYTALHFAALSGDMDICQLLLEHGAKISATNSVGRTPSQMAAFVGNHGCVAVINNFVPKSDIDYYTTPTGLEAEPKLPPHLSLPLHKFIMQVNLNPVKILMNLQKLQLLCENLDKVKIILELMSEREMKRGMETNEIMSFKFHYLGCIISELIKCKKLLSQENPEEKKSDLIEYFIKKLLKINKGDVPEFQESFLRECVRDFPHRECTIFRQMVTSLSRSDSPSALSVIMSAVNGQRGFADPETLICSTCGEERATKKCAKCKSVQYCDKECQKLHWFMHKKICSKLAEQLGNVKRDVSEKEKQNAISAATEMLASELSNLKSS